MSTLQRLHGKFRPGFTLLEAVFALLILAVSMPLLQGQMKALVMAVQVNNVHERDNWQLANCQLERFLDQCQVVQCRPSRVQLYHLKEQKNYQLETYRPNATHFMLRLRGAERGHMPVFQQLKAVTLTYQASCLTLTAVLRHSGETVQQHYYLEPKTKE